MSDAQAHRCQSWHEENRYWRERNRLQFIPAIDRIRNGEGTKVRDFAEWFKSCLPMFGFVRDEQARLDQLLWTMTNIPCTCGAIRYDGEDA